MFISPDGEMSEILVKETDTNRLGKRVQSSDKTEKSTDIIKGESPLMREPEIFNTPTPTPPPAQAEKERKRQESKDKFSLNSSGEDEKEDVFEDAVEEKS